MRARGRQALLAMSVAPRTPTPTAQMLLLRCSAQSPVAERCRKASVSPARNTSSRRLDAPRHTGMTSATSTGPARVGRRISGRPPAMRKTGQPETHVRRMMAASPAESLAVTGARERNSNWALRACQAHIDDNARPTSPPHHREQLGRSPRGSSGCTPSSVAHSNIVLIKFTGDSMWAVAGELSGASSRPATRPVEDVGVHHATSLPCDVGGRADAECGRENSTTRR